MNAFRTLARRGFLFATLSDAERAARVRAARQRIEAAEQKRRDDKRRRDADRAAKLARKQGKK